MCFFLKGSQAKTSHCPRPPPSHSFLLFGLLYFFSFWNLNFSNLDTYVSALPNFRRYRSFRGIRHGTCNNVRRTCQISGAIQVKKSFSFGSVGVSVNTSAWPTDQLLTAHFHSLNHHRPGPNQRRLAVLFITADQAGLRHLPITSCEKG